MENEQRPACGPSFQSGFTPGQHPGAVRSECWAGKAAHAGKKSREAINTLIDRTQPAGRDAVKPDGLKPLCQPYGKKSGAKIRASREMAEVSGQQS